MPKFMQSLGAETYQRLLAEAKFRDVTVQSLIRTIIVPDWLKTAPAATLPTTSIDTGFSKPIVGPTAILSRTGIVTEPMRRALLNTSIGRGRP